MDKQTLNQQAEDVIDRRALSRVQGIHLEGKKLKELGFLAPCFYRNETLALYHFFEILLFAIVEILK